MKLTIAALAVLASAGMAFAQSGSPDRDVKSDSHCLNMHIPLSQLPEKCKAERELMRNKSYGSDDFTTGSTSPAPAIIYPDQSDTILNSEKNNTGNAGNGGKSGSRN